MKCTRILGDFPPPSGRVTQGSREKLDTRHFLTTVLHFLANPTERSVRCDPGHNLRFPKQQTPTDCEWKTERLGFYMTTSGAMLVESFLGEKDSLSHDFSFGLR